MPQIPLQIDPERPHQEDDAPLPEQGSGVPSPAPDGPVSFVPHEPGSQAVTAPVRIRTNRYGELEEHELIKLIDTIEDERARARFRESIYISLFIWLAVVWVVFYGPRYLWHAPRLISPVDVMKQQALVQLNNPTLTAPPSPRVAPKLDNRTLEKLRSMEPKPVPRAPAPPPAPPSTSAPVVAKPEPPAPVPQPPVPTPKPLPSAPKPSAAVPEAPTPQPTTKPNFASQSSASDAIQQAMRNSERGSSSGSIGIHGSGGGAALGSGVDILSDTQGVDFQPYLQRIIREIYEQWLPLIPEEARPPLSKQGATQIRFTINPDGTIAAMHLDGSTYDDALNRAAWGSITGVGQFPPLPKQFHGRNLELRIHYLYNDRSAE